jgi:F5/8 type C domain
MSSPQEHGTSEHGAPSAVNQPAKARGGEILNWLLVRDELSLAHENAARITAQQREYLRRAKLAFGLGELALAPRDKAIASGSTAPLAADLFRQALYWALLSQSPSSAGAEPAAAWASADSAVLAGIADHEMELEKLQQAMGSTFVELAEASLEAQSTNEQLLRRAASRLITNAERVPWQLEWSKLKRVTRLGLLVFLCLFAVASVVVLWPAPLDLAKGKPWHASSSMFECHPEKSECAGATTDILFHTKEEQNPWFEYDFGAPLAFSSLTIRNRADYGPERAVPLVVEVSNDDKKFTEVARRVDSFSTWKPSFPRQTARYLRLRVDRVSMLHLEAVKVHP